MIATSTLSPKARFQVLNLEASAPVSPLHCPPLQSCVSEYDTPTLDWQPVIGASHYKVYIALDVNFTNIVSGTPYETQYSTLLRRSRCQTTSAGRRTTGTPRPCYGRSPERCGPEPATFAGTPGSPVFVFKKLSNTVPLISPADGVTVGGKVGSPGDANYTPGFQYFKWGGFLQTNCKAPLPTRAADSTLPAAEPESQGSRMRFRWSRQRHGGIGSRSHRNFSTLLIPPRSTNSPTPHSNKTYPDGPLYWRVAAIDGSSNRLTWSPTRTLTKLAPTATPNLPAAGDEVTGVPTLSVTPKAFESEWEFEIYKNLDQIVLAPANRVFNAKSAVAAATPTDLIPPLPPGEQYGGGSGGTTPTSPRFLDCDIGSRTHQVHRRCRPSVVGLAHEQRDLPNDRLFFEWNFVNQATRYKFEVNTLENFTGIKPENDVTTVGNSWAPRVCTTTGTYWWRVSSLDADGNVLATSPARWFNTGEQGSRYESMAPIRVVDSRVGNGWSGRLAAGTSDPRNRRFRPSGAAECYSGGAQRHSGRVLGTVVHDRVPQRLTDPEPRIGTELQRRSDHPEPRHGEGWRRRQHQVRNRRRQRARRCGHRRLLRPKKRR